MLVEMSSLKQTGYNTWFLTQSLKRVYGLQKPHGLPPKRYCDLKAFLCLLRRAFVLCDGPMVEWIVVEVWGVEEREMR